MRIKIEHISNTFNYGSLMMAINTLKYIEKHMDNIEFYVDCKEEDLDRLKKETEINNLQSVIEYNFKSNNLIEKILRLIKIAKRDGKNYDLKIVLGGDDISEYYGKNIWVIKFPIMYIQNKYLPTIFLGQTIGPFSGVRKILARIVLGKTKIYTRDDTCFEYLNSIGVKSINRGRDLAFLDLPIQCKSDEVLTKYKLGNEQYITIVPSGLSKWYTKNYDNYLKEQVNLIYKLLKNKSLGDTKIVLLAHVLKPLEVDDRKVIDDLQNCLSKQLKERIIVITDELLASEARAILGNGLLTITGRMHAAVSTLYMRKPAISLSYSVKYEGVIGNGLDLGELVIECADEDLWKRGEVSKQVAEKVDYVVEHYGELIHKIDKNVRKTSEMSIEQLENVVKDIKTVEVKRKM